jgi:hypothetical protein
MMRLKIQDADGHWITANVFVDEGSDSTLMRQGFAKLLKLRGAHHILTVVGAGNVINHYPSQRISFDIRDSDGSIVAITCSTLPTVASDTPVTDWPVLKKRWSHLADLPVTMTGGKVDILIGTDRSPLVTALESRIGGDYEPTAVRNRFGWLIRGVVQDGTTITAVRTNTIIGSTQLAQLTDVMRQFCETENFGTEYQVAGMSEDHRKAVSILDGETRKLNVGYEVPITWREGEPNLMCNRRMADDRFKSLLRRFERDPEFEADYRKAMQKNFEKGYASILSGTAAEEAKYFLAHHGVYKGPKLRVVFDAAAPFKGKCLNDAILSGPALQPVLPAVLTQFREGEVAWAADVEAMFSRFRLRPTDANYFCFLWREVESAETIVCRMDRLPFGATCSPFIAIHTCRRAAIDAKADEKIVEVIKKKVYVDDYLSSASSVRKGLEEAVVVEKILSAADLHLQGWISNSPEFVQSIMKRDASDSSKATPPPISHSLSNTESGKVLGLVWNTLTDSLGFRVENLEEIEFTRAGIASKVASIFDPLGTAAPLIVKAKIRLRSLGMKGVNWLGAVDESDESWWKCWFAVVRQLINTSLDRCLFPEENEIENSQLHTFCDASEEAYAAVIYVRNAYRDGRIRIHQIKASNKLAPKKTISVPKLELNAALLGSRLARFVSSSISRKIDNRFFWTDSSTVRNWIRATASYYQVYVSNRVGEIQTLTEPEEWRFVPGKLNPADEATRSVIEEEGLSQRWLNGPEFLFQPESEWPQDLPWIAVPDEMRTCRTYAAQLATDVSDWSDIPLNQSNISEFLKLEGPSYQLIERCQKESFYEEINCLKKGKAIRSTSHLLQLSPFLGPDNLLRLGGRIGHAKLPYDSIHPPILPSKHPLTERLIAVLHEHTHHAGTNFLLAKINQHFWIVRGRETVKKIRQTCPVCIRERGAPVGQLMGDLPAFRLDSYSPPFSHVAIDCFGPLETSPGRNRVFKRYGVIITCLVTRGVFLALAESLSTEDFLLVFRRFIGIYTKPATVHSDNGTNFVGAENELNSFIQELPKSGAFQQFLKVKNIDWRFQPPRAPHFGGAHESLIRSTKRALYRALEIEKAGLRYPSDEMLRTLLAEVGGMLNARPLTYTSTDPADFRPLTPNDFLNRPPTYDLPPGDFSDALPRERFRYVQRTAQLFWDLWTKFYLPSLVPRKKWKTKQQNLAIGDVVLMIDSNQPRGQWKLGHIIKTFPGEDGLVRVVEVQADTGIYKRAVHRLCLLERAPKDSSTIENSQADPAEASRKISTAHCHRLRAYYCSISP